MSSNKSFIEKHLYFPEFQNWLTQSKFYNQEEFGQETKETLFRIFINIVDELESILKFPENMQIKFTKQNIEITHYPQVLWKTTKPRKFVYHPDDILDILYRN